MYQTMVRQCKAREKKEECFKKCSTTGFLPDRQLFFDVLTAQFISVNFCGAVFDHMKLYFD